jgi:hypothetical protein
MIGTGIDTEIMHTKAKGCEMDRLNLSFEKEVAFVFRQSEIDVLIETSMLPSIFVAWDYRPSACP